MRIVVVYESMYGNTHVVADAIGRGLGSADTVTVVPVAEAGPERLDDADLVVVGGPTHMFGMSRPGSQRMAAEAAQKPGSGVALDPAATGRGLREWFDALGPTDAQAAAFDTRFRRPALLTGRASKPIARRLRTHGFDLVAKPESFFVTTDNQLLPGEEFASARVGTSSLGDGDGHHGTGRAR